MLIKTLESMGSGLAFCLMLMSLLIRSSRLTFCFEINGVRSCLLLDADEFTYTVW